MTDRAARVRALRRNRPRNRFARRSGIAFLALIIASWTIGLLPWRGDLATSTFVRFSFDDTFSARRLDNLSNFLLRMRPKPVREGGDIADGFAWVIEKIKDPGIEATVNTLAVAIASIVLAAAIGFALSLPASRNLASPQPYLPDGKSSGAIAKVAWAGIWFAARSLLIFLRAIPEYVWGFLLLTIFGINAWPAVLALALHNAGILGKLGAEVVENAEPNTPRALRSVGLSRAQLFSVAVLPQALPRFLLYFFYRWETCVREATVLGMLGFATLGYWIAIEAAPRFRYDELVLLIALGAALVLAGDLVSAVARRFVRNAR